MHADPKQCLAGGNARDMSTSAIFAIDHMLKKKIDAAFADNPHLVSVLRIQNAIRLSRGRVFAKPSG